MSQTAHHESAEGSIDLRRLQFLTENYTHLQGLRLIPFGVAFMAKPLIWGPQLDKAVLLGLMTVAVVLFYWIGLYYKRTFGRVQRRRSAQLRDTLAVVLFFAAVVASLSLEERFQPPVSLLGLSMAALFVYIYRCSAGQRPYYLAVAALFASLSLVPLLGIARPDEIFGRPGWLGDIALGAAYLFVGILDHLLLVRSLKPLPEESDADAV